MLFSIGVSADCNPGIAEHRRSAFFLTLCSMGTIEGLASGLLDGRFGQ